MKQYVLQVRGKTHIHADWTSDGEFEAHLAKMFFFKRIAEHTIKFESVAEAYTAYAWIKEEYPEYKNRIEIRGLVITFK